MTYLINNFSLERDTFMPEMHLRQPTALGNPKFNYIAC